MARPLRIEYAGAVYHVMARGNQGRAIFRDDEDRGRFLDTVGEACERTGWWIHAYVLRGNNYHLLVETPEGNLVAGMKWLQGTYTQRYNGRHELRGHLFQGRYQAVIIDGSSPGYFEVVGTYIHLNPARAGLIQVGRERLKRYRWSSYPWYVRDCAKINSVIKAREFWPLARRERRAYPASGSVRSEQRSQRPKGPARIAEVIFAQSLSRAGKSPTWLRRERVMGGLGMKEGEQKRYEAYLESRVLELGLKEGRQELEAQWRALRRGWYVGGPDFLEKLKARLGALLAGKRRESHSGEAKRTHGEAAAEALLADGLAALGLGAKELSELPKSAPEKTVLAWWLRERTTVPLRWVSGALDMGHYTRVTQAVSRMRCKPGRALEKLKRQLLQAEENEV